MSFYTKSGFWLRVVPVVIFAGMAALFMFALRSGDPSHLPSVLLNKPAPAGLFAKVDGLTKGGEPVPGFDTSELADGKVKLVNFFASWCAPCISEHPVLDRLSSMDKIPIYGVNTRDKPTDARRFLATHGNPYIAVGADPDGRKGIDWGVYGTPETYVVNGDGVIVYRHVGPMSPDDLTNKVLPAIEGAREGTSAS